MRRSKPVYEAIKRIADIAAASVLLVVLSPLLLAVALLVRVRLGSPVLFAQSRPGRDGRIFTIYKFRSMREASSSGDAIENVATDADRLTPLGRAIRATSLDELPSLLNVLRGDMSFVGPRPLLPEYLERYNSEQARRHEVRPGITGWAQVNGRNAVSWEARFAMDVWYVDHRSLALDTRILAMTIGQVFRRSGVSAEGHATMPPFEPRRHAEETSEEDS